MRCFKAGYRNAGYTVYLDSLNRVTIPLVFDTGAVNTVISLETFYKGATDESVMLKHLKKECVSKVFHSASGSTLEGFLVAAEGIYLSGYLINRFFYYLILDSRQHIALLGDDFISCCMFRHESKGDIVVSGFDSVAYEDDMKSAITQNRLNQLLQLFE